MNPTPWKLEITSDIEEELLPFSFKGFGLESKCFLRYSIKNGRCFVLIAQLPDYLGTDVTTGFDDIFEAFARRLCESSSVSFLPPKDTGYSSILRKIGLISPAVASESDRLKSAMAFCMGASWVVCYPPGVGLISNESFAEVRIDEDRNFYFNYRCRENVVRRLGIQDDDLAIDYEALDSHIRGEDCPGVA